VRIVGSIGEINESETIQGNYSIEGNYSIDGGDNVTFAITTTGSLLGIPYFTTPVLTQGHHSLLITNITNAGPSNTFSLDYFLVYNGTNLPPQSISPINSTSSASASSSKSTKIPSPTSDPHANQRKQNAMNPGAISGIVIGILGVIVVFAGVFLYKRSRGKVILQPISPYDIQDMTIRDTAISTVEEGFAGSIVPFTPLGTSSNGSIKELPQLTVLPLSTDVIEPVTGQMEGSHMVELGRVKLNRPLSIATEGGIVSREIVRYQDSGMRQILDVPPLYTED